MSERPDIVERLRMWAAAPALQGYVVIDWSGERDQCRLVQDLGEAAREIASLRAQCLALENSRDIAKPAPGDNEISEPRFTPGPWHEAGYIGPVILFSDSQNRAIGEVRSENAGEDARLVAAAPDLYGALSNLLDVWANEGKVPGWANRFVEAKRRGYAALARATE